MKTKNQIRPIFLDNVLNFTLPKGWNELNDRQLYIVSYILSLYNGEEAKTHCIIRLLNINVIEYTKDGWLCECKLTSFKSQKFLLTTVQIQYFSKILDYIFEPCSPVVRINKIKGLYAVDANLHNVSFEDYLVCENLYQGFLVTNDYNLLRSLALVLYTFKNGGKAKHCKFDIAELTSVLIWFTGVKYMFSKLFSNFFQKVGTSTEQPNMVDVMNNEIRILTQGDITKESIILNLDCWRALTELDAKAKEIQELKRDKK